MPDSDFAKTEWIVTFFGDGFILETEIEAVS